MKLSAGERSPIKAADWLEAQVIYYKTQGAHKSDIVNAVMVEGALVDSEDWEDHDLTEPEDDRSGPGTRLADNTAVEIERRQALCGEAYPFSFRNGMLRWLYPEKWADPYLVCLLAADREHYQPGDDTGKVFEHLTTLAVRSFLGGCAERFGHPRDSLPKRIDEALCVLAQQTSSKFINTYPVEPSTDKDLGLDVVGWKGFPDHHNSQLQLYVQCATGEGWMEKTGDLNLDRWGKILDTGVRPVKALAIPYVVAGDGKWLPKIVGHLILDRLRLSIALHGQDLGGGTVCWADWVQKRKACAKAVG